MIRCDACGKRHEQEYATCPVCEQPMRAVVWVTDYHAALAQLTPSGDIHPLGAELLSHARDHLTIRLRAHLVGAMRWQTEKAAMAYVKGLATDLQKAGQELLQAAETMRAKGGQGNQAQRAFVAHKAAMAKAHEVLHG